MANAEKCSDCRHCNDSYCDVCDQKVNPSGSACPEFEER